MSRVRTTVFISCILAFSAAADVEISLSGTVKDAKGFVIAGAEISFASDASLKCTSDESGKFAFGDISSEIRGRETALPAPHPPP